MFLLLRHCCTTETGSICQAEAQRLKQVVVAKGKELQEAQAPLLGLRAQRTTLEAEKRDKAGKTTVSGLVFF